MPIGNLLLTNADKLLEITLPKVLFSIMGQHLRVELPECVNLITTRTIQSRLWFITEPFQKAFLQRVAVCVERHLVELYALVCMGNHYHSCAKFPLGNRAFFQRDFNSAIQKSVKRLLPRFKGGPLWARRYSNEFIPEAADIEKEFFYCALQPVRAGLCEHIEDYPGYNSFDDAVSGKERPIEVIDWTAYSNAKRSNPNVDIKKYQKIILLKYKRLPGYELLSQEQYRTLMYKKLEEQRIALIAERQAKGKSFMGKTLLCKQKLGVRPKNTKTSTRFSFRPIILCSYQIARKAFLSFFFDVLSRFKKASEEFRKGNLTVIFPPGTYRPFLLETRIDC